jgi:hypothetical protein
MSVKLASASAPSQRYQPLRTSRPYQNAQQEQPSEPQKTSAFDTGTEALRG